MSERGVTPEHKALARHGQQPAPGSLSGGQEGILLAAFGSGSRQGESLLRLFDEGVRARFPTPSVRWAFTSDLMRQRLASAHKKSDSVGKALRRMAFERFTKIVVQPLHLVPGVEYGDIAGEVERFIAETRESGPKGFCPRISLGAPLLCLSPTASLAADLAEDPADNQTLHPAEDLAGTLSVTRAAKALLASLPAEREACEPVLWMGHGSGHASTKLYSALGRAAEVLDPLVFVGTINGEVRLEDLLPRLDSVQRGGARRVWLLPLLGLVGRHALEDMAGISAQSWKSRLEKAGFTCTPVLRGLIECPAFAEIWLDHLEAAWREES